MDGERREIDVELTDKLVRDEVCRRMGLEREEYDRLIDLRSSPELRGQDSFGRGWVPVEKQ